MKPRKPLKRSTKLIRKTSKKRDLLNVARREFVKYMLLKHPKCVACRIFALHDKRVTFVQRDSVDVHELLRRSQGGSIIDEENCICVCRVCHNRIGDEPNLAVSLGLARRAKA